MFSVSESERVLRRCSAFVYMGKERFVGILPPERLAALNLSGTATLFFLHLHAFSSEQRSFYVEEILYAVNKCALSAYEC